MAGFLLFINDYFWAFLPLALLSSIAGKFTNILVSAWAETNYLKNGEKLAPKRTHNPICQYCLRNQLIQTIPDLLDHRMAAINN